MKVKIRKGRVSKYFYGIDRVWVMTPFILIHASPETVERKLTAMRPPCSYNFPFLVRVEIVVQQFSGARTDDTDSLLSDVVFEPGAKHHQVCIESASVAEGQTGFIKVNQGGVVFDLYL